MIYKYDFTTESASNMFGYLKNFLTLLVRDSSNPRTLDYFSSVTIDQSDDNEWHIYCWVSGSDVPAIEYSLVGPTLGWDYRGAFIFNGTDMQRMSYSILTSETAPTDWETNYESYYWYDDEEDEYVQRTSADDFPYEPSTYYRGLAEDWFRGIPQMYTVSDCPRYGYLTSKGVMLVNRNGTATIISKTNNNKLALVTMDEDCNGRLAARYVVMADGDTIDPYNSPQLSFLYGDLTSSSELPIDHQTSFAPITTHRTDIASYLDGAYMIPQSQYRGEGVLSVGGDRYATNGFFALKE